jgi:hypothetical protein
MTYLRAVLSVFLLVVSTACASKSVRVSRSERQANPVFQQRLNEVQFYAGPPAKPLLANSSYKLVLDAIQTDEDRRDTVVRGVVLSASERSTRLDRIEIHAGVPGIAVASTDKSIDLDVGGGVVLRFQERVFGESYDLAQINGSYVGDADRRDSPPIDVPVNGRRYRLNKKESKFMPSVLQLYYVSITDANAKAQKKVTKVQGKTLPP